MTAYTPRPIVKKIRYSDITAATTTSQQFYVEVPASFFVTAVYYRIAETFAAATSVASINLSVGVASAASTPVSVDTASLMAIADVKTIGSGYPTLATATVDATGLRENGVGYVSISAPATIQITVTPTYVGAFSAGEVDVIVLGFQLPYPA